VCFSAVQQHNASVLLLLLLLSLLMLLLSNVDTFQKTNPHQLHRCKRVSQQ